MDLRKRVLFLCTGNSARSRWLKLSSANTRVNASTYSGGLSRADSSAHLSGDGGNRRIPAGQRSKPVEEYLTKVHFPTLVTVCDDAEKNCPTVWPGLVTRLHWSFEDPAALKGPMLKNGKIPPGARPMTEGRAWLEIN
jgi:arsenate reductase